MMASSRWANAVFGAVALGGCGFEPASEAPESGELGEVAQAALSANPCTAVRLTAPAQDFAIAVGVPIVLSGAATCPPGQTPEYQYWAKRADARNWTSLGPRTAYVSGSTTWIPPDDGWCVTVVARAVGAPESYQARASSKCSAPRLVRVHVPTDQIEEFEALFYGPDNQLITRSAFTDGVASAAMPAGGTVIVYPDPLGGTDDLRAVFGVEPGDDLKLFPVFDVHGGDLMTITVPPAPGATIYYTGMRCGGGGSTTTTLTAFTYRPFCEPPFDVLVEALGPGGMLGALRGTASSDTSAALSGPYLPPETVSLSVTNGIRSLMVDSALTPIVERVASDWLSTSTSRRPLPPSSTLALSYRVAPGSLVDARKLELILEQSSAIQRFERVIAPTDVAITFDARAEGLPWYEHYDYDVGTRTVQLSRSAGAELDGQEVRVNFANDYTPRRTWACVFPPDATEVVLPVLPAAFVDFDPSGPFITAHTVAPLGIRASEYQGYADLRQGKPLTHPIGSSFDTTTAIVPGL